MFVRPNWSLRLLAIASPRASSRVRAPPAGRGVEVAMAVAGVPDSSDGGAPMADSGMIRNLHAVISPKPKARIDEVFPKLPDGWLLRYARLTGVMTEARANRPISTLW